MGSCCKGMKKVDRPVQVDNRKLAASKTGYIEEESKNPELYRKSSCFSQSEGAELPNELLQVDLLRMSSKGPSRKQSEFNAQKDMVESLRRERLKSITQSTADKQSTVQLFQLTKEQHETIYQFVRTVEEGLNEGVLKLNDNLNDQIDETEDLALIIEEMKSNKKDIENCWDDLKMFPVPDQYKFYEGLSRDCTLVKDINTEYIRLQNKQIDFRLFKKRIQSYIQEYLLPSQGSPDNASKIFLLSPKANQQDRSEEEEVPLTVDQVYEKEEVMKLDFTEWSRKESVIRKMSSEAKEKEDVDRKSQENPQRQGTSFVRNKIQEIRDARVEIDLFESQLFESQKKEQSSLMNGSQLKNERFQLDFKGISETFSQKELDDEQLGSQGRKGGNMAMKWRIASQRKNSQRL